MGRNVHLNDGWDEHAVNNLALPSDPDPSPKYAFAVLAEDLPIYWKIASILSGMERKVYDLLYVQKIGSKRDVAKQLKKPTRDVTKYCQRIELKLGRCWLEIKPIRIVLPDSDSEEETDVEDSENLSRRNCNPQAGDTSNAASVCLVLPTFGGQAE